MSVPYCVQCRNPVEAGKLTERGLLCVACLEQVPADPRIDPRRLHPSRGDRRARPRQRDIRQDRPL